MIDGIMREHVTKSKDTPLRKVQKGSSHLPANNSSHNAELCSLCITAPQLLDPIVQHLLLLLPVTSPNPDSIMVPIAAARESQGEHSTCHHEGGEPPPTVRGMKHPSCNHSFIHGSYSSPALFQGLTCKRGQDDTAPAPPTWLRQDIDK